MKGGETYTDGDGVVPSKVMPDMVILELLNRFTSAIRYLTQLKLSEEEMKSEERVK